MTEQTLSAAIATLHMAAYRAGLRVCALRLEQLDTGNEDDGPAPVEDDAVAD